MHDTDDTTRLSVLAAGALCWRVRHGKLQVLLIHRPRYNDWSWPKGKQDSGETPPQTAVREVREEIGLKVVLGRPLPHTDYPVQAGRKRVFYWAAEAPKQRPQPDGHEVDTIRWASPQRAKKLLSNPSDFHPLDALVAAYDAGALHTWPLLLVRHAKTKPRASWEGADGKRPLSSTGRQQAAIVARLIKCWKPQRLLSSPWTRCVTTLSPYAQKHNIDLKVSQALTEAHHHDHSHKTRQVLNKVFVKRRSVAICVHRPTLPTLLQRLQEAMSTDLAAALPSADPYLAPGEVLVCQVAGEHVVSVERFPAE